MSVMSETGHGSIDAMVMFPASARRVLHLVFSLMGLLKPVIENLCMFALLCLVQGQPF